METIGLVIAYDGTPFVGWQHQAGSRSIQGCLEEALTKIHGVSTGVRAASRTDAGVHAEWQVAAFDTTRDYSPERWRMALNALTPPEILVRHAIKVPDGFQPRFESRGKHYRYWLYPGYYVPPFWRNRAAQTRPLDINRMQKAARYLLGEHDFSAFRAVDCQAKSPVRTITDIQVSHGPEVYQYPCEQAEFLIQVDVKGTAFLKQMVRIIVGTLIEFGLGRPPQEMAEILLSKDRTQAGQTAPACGLTLVRAYSPLDDWITPETR